MSYSTQFRKTKLDNGLLALCPIREWNVTVMKNYNSCDPRAWSINPEVRTFYIANIIDQHPPCFNACSGDNAAVINVIGTHLKLSQNQLESIPSEYLVQYILRLYKENEENQIKNCEFEHLLKESNAEIETLLNKNCILNDKLHENSRPLIADVDHSSSDGPNINVSSTDKRNCNLCNYSWRRIQKLKCIVKKLKRTISIISNKNCNYARLERENFTLRANIDKIVSIEHKIIKLKREAAEAAYVKEEFTNLQNKFKKYKKEQKILSSNLSKTIDQYEKVLKNIYNDAEQLKVLKNNYSYQCEFIEKLQVEINYLTEQNKLLANSQEENNNLTTNKNENLTISPEQSTIVPSCGGVFKDTLKLLHQKLNKILVNGTTTELLKAHHENIVDALLQSIKPVKLTLDTIQTKLDECSVDNQSKILEQLQDDLSSLVENLNESNSSAVRISNSNSLNVTNKENKSTNTTNEVLVENLHGHNKELLEIKDSVEIETDLLKTENNNLKNKINSLNNVIQEMKDNMEADHKSNKLNYNEISEREKNHKIFIKLLTTLKEIKTEMSSIKNETINIRDTTLEDLKEKLVQIQNQNKSLVESIIGNSRRQNRRAEHDINQESNEPNANLLNENANLKIRFAIFKLGMKNQLLQNEIISNSGIDLNLEPISNQKDTSVKEDANKTDDHNLENTARNTENRAVSTNRKLADQDFEFIKNADNLEKIKSDPTLATQENVRIEELQETIKNLQTENFKLKENLDRSPANNINSESNESKEHLIENLKAEILELKNEILEISNYDSNIQINQGNANLKLKNEELHDENIILKRQLFESDILQVKYLELDKIINNLRIENQNLKDKLKQLTSDNINLQKYIHTSELILAEVENERNKNAKLEQSIKDKSQVFQNEIIKSWLQDPNVSDRLNERTLIELPESLRSYNSSKISNFNNSKLSETSSKSKLIGKSKSKTTQRREFSKAEMPKRTEFSKSNQSIDSTKLPHKSTPYSPMAEIYKRIFNNGINDLSLMELTKVHEDVYLAAKILNYPNPFATMTDEDHKNRIIKCQKDIQILKQNKLDTERSRRHYKIKAFQS